MMILIYNNTSNFLNTTGYLQSYEADQWKKSEILSLVINIVNFLACLWILFSLLNYSIYKLMQRRKSFEHKSNLLVNFACFTTMFPLIRIIATQQFLTVKLYSIQKIDLVCHYLVSNVSDSLYFVSLMMVYVFPWLRQHYLYQQPLMKHLNTKLVKVISITLLLYSIVNILTIGFLNVSYLNYQMDVDTLECIRVKTTLEVLRSKEIVYYISCISTFGFLFSQISLFALLMYPVLKHRKNRVSKQSKHSKKMLDSILKQGIVSLVIITCVPIGVGILRNNSHFTDDVPLHLQEPLLDIGLSILLFSVVFSFQKWKSILTFSFSSKSPVSRFSTINRKSTIRSNCQVSRSSHFHCNNLKIAEKVSKPI